MDRMEAFVRRAGLSDVVGGPGGPQFIHVAGTNGKGSVTAYLQSLLVEGGFRTGAFFSPFVYDPRERVQLGRDMISREDLALLTAQLQPIAESFSDTDFGGITEFEFKTALGFLYWKRKQCEWVALEVGLGGRLDATNVVTPKASVIVSIGLDHTAILGHTVAGIAFEKAGVIKPGVTVVAGKMPIESLSVIQYVAKDQGSEIWRFGKEITTQFLGDGSVTVTTPLAKHENLRSGMWGAWQAHNLALAIGAIDAAEIVLTPEAFALGTKRAKAPGRFESAKFKGKRMILDGAHNEDAGKALAFNLWQLLRPNREPHCVLVTNMVGGHDPASFYKEIAPFIKSAHVVPIGFHRATPVEETAAVLRNLVPSVQVHDSVMGGLEAAAADSGRGDSILVTGSFYLVGEVGRAIKFVGS